MYDSRDLERKPSLRERKLGLDLGSGELVDLESSWREDIEINGVYFIRDYYSGGWRLEV